MKQINLLGISILFLTILSCGSSTSKNTTDNIYSEWNSFETNEYTIQYPKTWRLDTSGYQGTELSIFSRQTSLLDKFIENVSLAIYIIPDRDIDFTKYIELTEEKIKAVAIDNLLLVSERIKTNEADFQKIIYTKKQGIYILEFEQYYWLLNNKAYVLTLICKANEFKNYKKTGENILNSFKLK